jgi:polyhydroxybutyrate depolymerase
MVYPQGKTDSYGNPFWNAGTVSISVVNDTLFLNQLIDSLSLLFNIDLNKVFMTGLSNGGFMSHYMACFCNRKITAIASVAGTFFTFWPVCNPGKAVPMMHIHGTSDPTVSYYGNSSMLSADSTVKRWFQKNGCNPVASYSLVPDINTSDASTAEHYRYFINGNTKSIVEFFKINNGAHTWPGSPFIIGTTNQDINASAEIWRFFRQFSANDFTNVSSIEKKNIIYKVFPNPAQSFLNIISIEIINSIKIIDIAGKTIFSDSYSFPTKFLKLEISNFEKGVYIININNQSYIKFIKQ